MVWLRQELSPGPGIRVFLRVTSVLNLAPHIAIVLPERQDIIQNTRFVGFHLNPSVALGVFKHIDEYLKST
jgi:hypothetical protein